MAIDIKVPAAGESITSANIAKWYKSNGDFVKKGDALVSLETDKVSNELEAEADGILTITVGEGEEVSIGTVTCTCRCKFRSRSSASNRSCSSTNTRTGSSRSRSASSFRRGGRNRGSCRW
jgi:2-oxoglutarate dehydrogenase E2 component (dihydrolipoamide succinyltransferase)